MFEPGKAGRFGVVVMNCKQGDLAIVARSCGVNTGAIVEIIRPLGVEPFWGGVLWNMKASKGSFSWLVRTKGRPLKTTRGLELAEAPMPDKVLRPLRGSNGEDEVLRLVGKPADYLVGA